MFVARKKELADLNSLINKNKSTLSVIYGRRRVGKTEIVRHFISSSNLASLEITGEKNSDVKSQLQRFSKRLNEFMSKNDVNLTIEKIGNWDSAFSVLEDCLNKIQTKEKKVLFFDEFPWLDSRRSKFLSAFSYFWNNFCERRDDLIVIVCGSAATYMINNILDNKKSLNNRVSLRLHLEAFNLKESAEFIRKKGCIYSNKSVADIYFVFGGVAYYLENLDPELQPNQNINKLCFGKNGLLQAEYGRLFESLFENAQVHRKIMDALVSKWSGFNQIQLQEKIKDFGLSAFPKPLRELEQSGFISSYTKFGNIKKERVYRAIDPFSYFHNKWIKANRNDDWNRLCMGQSYKSWRGFAFENLCLIHIEKIKEVLGISGVSTNSHYWSYRAKDENEKGAQIDILLEHTNGSKNIDIIECKYYDGTYTMNKSQYEELKSKITVFQEQTNFKYNIRIILITSDGVVKNEYYNELINLDITVDQLME